METSSRRRRRAVWLIAGLLLACIVGYIGYSLNWISQRHGFISSNPRRAIKLEVPDSSQCPLLLRPFSEQGWDWLKVDKVDEIDATERMFPEATVFVTAQDGGMGIHSASAATGQTLSPVPAGHA